MSFEEAIKGILLRCGGQVIKDEKVFLSIFQDLYPKLKKERAFLALLYRCHIMQNLVAYKNASLSEKKICVAKASQVSKQKGNAGASGGRTECTGL